MFDEKKTFKNKYARIGKSYDSTKAAAMGNIRTQNGALLLAIVITKAHTL